MQIKTNPFCGKDVKIYLSGSPFVTEKGDVVDNLRVAYHTYGKLSEKKDNVLWICHALTANSDVADWWPGLFGEGRLYDPTKYFIVCANKLGSPYGSTSPLNTENCPTFTIRDNIAAFQRLAEYLGIDKIKVLIGGSTGGAQAMEWAIMEPERILNLGLIGIYFKTTSWITAFSETQKMAIESARSEEEGLSTARAISMMLYRGPLGYQLSQTTERVGGYQRHQGDKFAKRYDAACYLQMLETLFSHDVTRGRGNAEDVLGTIKAKTVCIAIDNDLAFRDSDILCMSEMIPNGTFVEIHSDYGHDGFLLEFEQVTKAFEPLFK